ncbi:MAG: sigma 54-interacting transcriptional regulator [Thermodesulfobacteriota bacterium]|nr:sigma 54-interacting transcriptional regulator [Thermodesulfobacteriota bacterium]
MDELKGRDIILDSITDGVFTVDHEWRITSFNRAAEEITGVPREDAIGQLCKDVLKADICEGNCALRQTLETGETIRDKIVNIINAGGEQTPISISSALLKDEDGKIIGAVETFRDISLVEKLRRKIEQKYTFQDIISKNHRMYELFDILPDVADSLSTVLIEGESGTGKELFARAIHNLSPRKNKQLVTVNCGAMPDPLLESELFGYKAGAFTDARRDKPGRFSLAEGGTIFLDEIGDVSQALQVRLLRVLQEKTFEPLGAVKSEQADVHIITATNQNLFKMVKQGRFREDLYYRINVIKLELPPLRERKEDIPLLVDHFIKVFCSVQGKAINGITDEALAFLMSYDYPGNIRELENIIERSFILCKSKMIMPSHLPEPVCVHRNLAHPEGVCMTSLKDIEAGFLTNALKRNKWNRLKTAKELGIHKSTLFRKIKTLGLEIPKT